jgi:hypothetical protein
MLMTGHGDSRMMDVAFGKHPPSVKQGAITNANIDLSMSCICSPQINRSRTGIGTRKEQEGRVERTSVDGPNSDLMACPDPDLIRP